MSVVGKTPSFEILNAFSSSTPEQLTLDSLRQTTAFLVISPESRIKTPGDGVFPAPPGIGI